MNLSLSFALMRVVAVVLVGSVVSAHAGAIQACKWRAASVAEAATSTSVNDHMRRVTHSLSVKISGNQIVKVWTPPDGEDHGSHHNDIVRVANSVLHEAGFGDVHAQAAVEAAYESERLSWQAFRQKSPQNIPSSQIESYVKRYNQYGSTVVEKFRQEMANHLREAIVARYCTNDPTDCYGVLDIDARTGIVHNETTGRNVDLSVCLSAGLAGSNLSNRNLGGINLAGADLRGTNFQGANLAEANLSGADLRGANLGRANLVRTVLAKANLAGSDLSEAVLEHANLAAANFKDAIATRANFAKSNLGGAILDGADLTETVFTNAALGAASLKGATLRGARFIGARIALGQLAVANWAGAIVEAVHAKALNDLSTDWTAFSEEISQ